MTIRQRLIIALLVLFLSGVANARNLVIVVDVSGSMRNYGAWQSDANTLVNQLLSGNSPGLSWSFVGSKEKTSAFKVDSNDKIYLIPFGSVAKDAKYPFFERIQGPIELQNLDASFPKSGNEFRALRTNKPLAMAVAAKMGLESSQEALVIMISDFLVDADLSDEQIAFANEMEKSEVLYTIGTFSWLSNPHVQAKLLRFLPDSNSQSVQPIPTAEHGKLRIASPQYDESRNILRIAWTYIGKPEPVKYGVNVRSIGVGTPVLNRENVAVTSIEIANPPAGQLRLTVTAFLADNTSIVQSQNIQIPQKRGDLSVFLIALFLIALVGFFLWAKRSGSLPLWMKVNRKKELDF